MGHCEHDRSAPPHHHPPHRPRLHPCHHAPPHHRLDAPRRLSRRLPPHGRLRHDRARPDRPPRRPRHRQGHRRAPTPPHPPRSPPHRLTPDHPRLAQQSRRLRPTSFTDTTYASLWNTDEHEPPASHPTRTARSQPRTSTDSHASVDHPALHRRDRPAFVTRPRLVGPVHGGIGLRHRVCGHHHRRSRRASQDSPVLPRRVDAARPSAAPVNAVGPCARPRGAQGPTTSSRGQSGLHRPISW